MHTYTRIHAGAVTGAEVTNVAYAYTYTYMCVWPKCIFAYMYVCVSMITKIGFSLLTYRQEEHITVN